jgi:hypothetical protein
MAAQKQQGQRVVLIRHLLVVGSRCKEFVGWYTRRDRVFAAPASLLTAQLVGHPPGGDRDQPAPRALRHASVGPLNGSCKQCLLHRVLTRIELPSAPDERAEDL